MNITTANNNLSKELEDFYTIKEVALMLRCSERSAQKLFNDPKFPSCDYFKQKVIHRNAFVEFFSKRHEKDTNNYWKD